MIVFYTNIIKGDFASLIGDEANHCARVLRKRAGDHINFIDGKGFFYESKLISVNKNICELEIIRKQEQYQPDYKIHIAISPLKSLPRFEWFIEKAVETGIDRVIPIICERTEKSSIRMNRLQNIVISASKQTLKAKFTVIDDPMNFNEVLDNYKTDQAFIPHLNEKTEFLGKMIRPSGSYLVFIGPEGDFTEDEVSIAISKGIIPASLGNNRLRTETAGIAAAQIVATINEISR
ncbi:MAG: RsmE family RNA methyltransferase [Deltaproteobacteria bacterium]